jgi:hypothetical protein
MKKALIITLVLIVSLISATFYVLWAQSDLAVQAQASFQTPTPNADGQIIYTVQDGDTCTRIFLLTGVTIDELITLNNLDAECTLYPSQNLILGTVEPQTSTPIGPLPTPTTPGPTPTPFEGTAQLCVLLFEDLDGNQMRSEGEFYLGGGIVSVNNRSGTYSETMETIGGNPDLFAMECFTADCVAFQCFEEIPEGNYNLSMGVPEGYIATTSLNLALEVTAGDTILIDFGAQPSSTSNIEDSPDVQQGRSPLLLAIGLILVAGGAGLTFFFIRSRGKS